MSTVFQNKQWSVTDFGIEKVQDEESPFEYPIPAERLLEQIRDKSRFYDWPIQIAEKPWADIEAFVEAFTKALEIHPGKYRAKVVQTMLDDSIAEARNVSERVQQRRSQRQA